MELSYWVNQGIITAFVATLTYIIWTATFQLTIHTIKHWSWFSLASILNFLVEAASNPSALLIDAYFSLTSIMKFILILVVFFIYLVMQLDAFIQSPYPRRARAIRLGLIDPRASRGTSDFTHDDILWMLRPPEGTPTWTRIGLRFASNIIRLEALTLGRDPPLVLCPKGGQAVIYAVYNGKRIGKFGITTIRGPPVSDVDESAQDCFNIKLRGRSVGAAAVIYMFVEPAYRKRRLGVLALEVISLVHAVQGCDFTMLVADDNGSGALIRWYEAQGYRQAPKLQALLGSPNKKYGTAMIAPTKRDVNPACRLKWW